MFLLVVMCYAGAETQLSDLAEDLELLDHALHEDRVGNRDHYSRRQEEELPGIGRDFLTENEELGLADIEEREENENEAVSDLFDEDTDTDLDLSSRGLKEEDLLEYSLREEINELPVETSKRVADFSSIKSQLSKALNSNDIPDEITDVVAALESAVNILKCIPTLRQGNCYKSNKYCDVKTKGFTLEIKITICKSPWSLRIDFKVPKDLKSKIPSWIRPFTFIDVSPVILRLDHRKDDGITQIVHNARIATAGLKLWFIKIKWVKAYFNFELKVRWDCTRPKNDNVKRLGYNIAYNDGKPGNDMNKLYYKLKIGYQVKTKRFPCFCYKCKKCETILHKQGHFAEGPNSCKSDWSAWSSCSKKGWWFKKRRPRNRTRTCVGQSTGGPPCPGSSVGRC